MAGADASDPRCPLGHEPVTERHVDAADRPTLSLVSAARVADPVTGRVDREGDYLLAIVRPGSDELLTSSKTYTWDEGTAKLSELLGLSWDDARRRWSRMGL